jgi:hypothetical protein
MHNNGAGAVKRWFALFGFREKYHMIFLLH